MATNLVPPKGSCIVRCRQCRGMYVPETTKTNSGEVYFERCPFCGYSSNNYKNTIPLWKYNLIKFFRAGSHVDDVEAGLTDFTCTTTTSVKTSGCSIEENLKLIEQLQKKLADIESKVETETAKPVKTKEHTTAKTETKKDDYLCLVNVQNDTNGRNDYWYYGFVKTSKELPPARDMINMAVYYVADIDLFVMPSGSHWSPVNKLNEHITGQTRRMFLSSADELPKNQKSKQRWIF